jgi:hypothetical protein
MQFVLMAIPTALVPQVADLLAGFSLTAEIAPGFESSGSKAGFPNEWTETLVRRAYQESADPMRQLLAFLADHADEEVTSEQIADALNAEKGWNTVAGMLGAFGRRSANRYERPRPMWDFRWDTDGRARLKMPAAVADVIKSVAGK